MRKSIRLWLYTGLFMILVQIVIGGITRLTGSGLSITRWEIVTGTMPPVNEAEWQAEFDLYKATPQYEKLNRGMSLAQFKFIYFWEYLHRLWARSIGIVFIVPFIIFVARRWIDRKLFIKLGGLVLFGIVVASFGWIMVASGLVDRPWVDAYKLSLHLGLGTLLFIYMLYVALDYDRKIHYLDFGSDFPAGHFRILVIVVFIQILLGGLMSGMRAALFYPTWPAIDGSWIPVAITDMSNWRWEHLTDYDKHPFAPALVQFLHRMTAYAIFIYGLLLLIRFFNKLPSQGKMMLFIFWALLIIQMLLGIFTLTNTAGSIPLTLGVLHQLGGILLFGVICFAIIATGYRKK